MRQIDYIFVHCTGTHTTATVSSIKAGFRQRGWQAPGYHYLVALDGDVHTLLPVSRVANGVKGYNSRSVHVAYIGGIDSTGKETDTRTTAQRRSLDGLLSRLHTEFPLARLLGHRDISPDKNHNGVVDPWERVKQCPCFDAKEEYANIINS